VGTLPLFLGVGSNDQSITLLDDGKVGIGNALTSPSATLHIKTYGSTTGEALRIDDSGSANKILVLDNGNTTFGQNVQSSTNTFQTFTQAAHTGGSPVGMLYTGGAHTTLATGAETTDINFNASATATIAGSTLLALNRTYRFQPRTYTAASATTWTEAATLDIGGAPTGGGAGPLTITNPWALRIAGGNTKTFGKIVYDATETAGGTTGNQTIDKPSGSVNIAAAGTTVTVTNSFCTATSHVFTAIDTNDGTAFIKNVVPAAGSFVINLGAAATAEVRISFLVIN